VVIRVHQRPSVGTGKPYPTDPTSTMHVVRSAAHDAQIKDVGHLMREAIRCNQVQSDA
jgi:hypothetical protein